MDFSAFKSLVDSIGMSAGNRYTVDLPAAVGFTEEDGAFCCSADIQTTGFETFKNTTQRPPVTMPYEVKFEPLGLEFYCPDDGLVFQKFLDWQELLMIDNNFLFNDFDTYATGNNVVVHEFSRQGEEIGTYTYYNCYPLSVGPKRLSYENRNAVNKFPVSLIYEYMT